MIKLDSQGLVGQQLLKEFEVTNRGKLSCNLVTEKRVLIDKEG